MEEKVKTMLKELDDFMKDALKESIGDDLIANMANTDDDTIMGFVKAMRLYNMSKDYALELAQKLDKIDSIEEKVKDLSEELEAINRKLDRILALQMKD